MPAMDVISGQPLAAFFFSRLRASLGASVAAWDRFMKSETRWVPARFSCSLLMVAVVCV